MTTALPRLIRIQRRKLEELRRQSAELETTASSFMERINALESEVAREKESAAAPGAGDMLVAYLQTVRDRRAQFERSLAEISRESDRVQTAISEAFQELKRLEAAQDMRQRRADMAARRRVRKSEDDVAVTTYRRRAG